MVSFVSFTSPTWQSLQSSLGVPPTKIPIDGITFASYVLPALVGHFAAAVLAVTPETRTIRLALWPVVALLALRAALSVDLSFGKTEHVFNNANYVLSMVAIAARTLDWTLSKGPLVRHLRPANSTPSKIMDALDLFFNFRGIGWDWSHYRLYTPRDTRPTTRVAFVFYVFLSAVAHVVLSGVVHRAILTLATTGFGSIPGGSTIFDQTLPPPIRYIRSSIISGFAAAMIYSTMQMSYDVCTVIAVLFLRQDPAQWPPAFDSPWLATSLSDLWGRRWHQFLRHIFLLGGRLLYPVFGHAGIIVGTFFGSVVWHQISLVNLSGQVEIWWMLAGFGLMGPCVLAERVFYRLTGRRVGGVFGWLWTMTWLLIWGNVIVEGFARAGMFGCSSPLDSGTPLRSFVERTMIDFDVWLHTI